MTVLAGKIPWIGSSGCISDFYAEITNSQQFQLLVAITRSEFRHKEHLVERLLCINSFANARPCAYLMVTRYGLSEIVIGSHAKSV